MEMLFVGISKQTALLIETYSRQNAYPDYRIDENHVRKRLDYVRFDAYK